MRIKSLALLFLCSSLGFASVSSAHTDDAQQSHTQPDETQSSDAPTSNTANPDSSVTSPTTESITPDPNTPTDPNTIVAHVGKENITLGEFERQFRIYVGNFVNSQGMALNDEVLNSFKQYRPEILQHIVRQNATLQLMNMSEEKPDLEEIGKQVDQIVSSNRGGFENDEAFTETLKKYGFDTEETFRKFITDSLIQEAFSTSVRDHFTFSPYTVLNYYNLHKTDFSKGGRVCAKHILVADEATANAVKARLEKGEDFAKLAQEVSKDPGSKNKGGNLGCFERGMMVKEFDQASFNGPIGKLQEVKTEFGVHLLMVTQRISAQAIPLMEVQDDILKALREQAFKKYLEGRLKLLNIETFVDKL